MGKSEIARIRRAQESDLEDALRIYEAARRFMRENGNPKQWGESYPPEETVKRDIAAGELYICEGEDGKTHAVFAFLENEPLYDNAREADFRIADYRAIHRVAADGEVRGAAAVCFKYCSERAKSLRIDTHEDNSVMQAQLEKFGFRRCGMVCAEDGSPRIAYEKEC